MWQTFDTQTADKLKVRERNQTCSYSHLIRLFHKTCWHFRNMHKVPFGVSAMSYDNETFRLAPKTF